MINGETTTSVTGPPQATGYAIVADTEFGAEYRKIEIIQSERAMARTRARSSAHATKSMTSPRLAGTWRVRTRKVGVPSCEQWRRSRVAGNSWGSTGVGEGALRSASSSAETALASAAAMRW